MSNARTNPGAPGPQNVATPAWLVEWLLVEFPITIDLAASEQDHIVSQFLSPEEDALLADWSKLTGPGMWGYCNPPFNSLKSTREKMGWAAKFRLEVESGARFVTLTPASLESVWYTDHFHGAPCEVQIIKGRLKFPGYKHGAASGHMLTVWDGKPFRGPWPRNIKQEAKEIAK